MRGNEVDSSMTRRTALVAAVALACLAGVGYVALNWTKASVDPGVDEGRTLIEAFLDDLRKGKAGVAWDGASTEFKSIEGRESFVARVKATPCFREQFTFSSTQRIKVNKDDRMEFAFVSSKSGKTVRVLLARERGAWKVDRLAL